MINVPKLYKYQKAARQDLRQGQKIVYRNGRYRIVPIKGFAPQTSSFAGLPEYKAPDTSSLMERAQRESEDISAPLLQRIYERQREEEANTRMQSERALQQQIAQYEAARKPIQDLYNKYIAGASTVEESIANRLKGMGEQRTGSMAEQLAAINAPGGAQNEAVQQARQTYQGQQASDYASGMSDVGSLMRRGAEQEAWLQRAPSLARAESQQELADALREIGQQYSGEAADLRANIPGQVRELYDTMFGQETQSAQSEHESRWQQIQHLSAERDKAVEARLAARAMGDKAAERAATARENALDRQLEAQIAALNEEGRMARQAPPKLTGPANQQFITGPDGSIMKNPNYKPGSGSSGGGAQQRLREQGAWKELRGLMLAKNKQGGTTNTPSQIAQHGKPAVINQKINAILSAYRINPNSAAGIRLRRQAWALVGDKTGPRGNPVG